MYALADLTDDDAQIIFERSFGLGNLVATPRAMIKAERSHRDYAAEAMRLGMSIAEYVRGLYEPA